MTDKRLLLRSGLWTRRIDMMPVSKVTDMSYERPFTGRVFGYGTFILESAGQDQALSRISYLPDSDRLYRETLTVIFGDPEPEQVARFAEEQHEFEAEMEEPWGPDLWSDSGTEPQAQDEGPSREVGLPPTIYGRRQDAPQRVDGGD